MSLFIIGSASRVTSNIVLQLAKNKQYSSVTIGDLLPSYDNYHRYYRLRRDIDNLQIKNFDLSIKKLFSHNQLYQHKDYDDVLFVTHDYYYHVTSKTELMKKVADVCKSRSHLFFATPVQYDHFNFSNPNGNYLQAQKKVTEIAPQSTIIRSNIQDKTEALSYINMTKNFYDNYLFNFYSNKNFAPRVVSSYAYAETVAQNLKDRTQGKRIFVDGKKQVNTIEVETEKGVESHQYAHAKTNIAQLTSKYNDILGEGCESIVV